MKGTDLQDKICICFWKIDEDGSSVGNFCNILIEKSTFEIFDEFVRYLPALQFAEMKSVVNMNDTEVY